MYKFIIISLIGILCFGQWSKASIALTLLSKEELKDDNLFSNPFIDELYKYGVVKINGDKVDVEIPFDSHSNDCGAPDCYQTMVSFQLPNKNPMILPEELEILYYDTGCYAEDDKSKSPLKFVMTQKGTDIIVYYNWFSKSSLVLFTRDNPKEGFSLAFFLVGISVDKLTPQDIYNLRDNYNEEDENSIYPYTSTRLRGY